MRKFIVSGIAALTIAIAPVAVAAQTAPTELSPAAESAEGSELRGRFANSAAGIVAIIGAVLVAYFVIRALVDDETPASP